MIDIGDLFGTGLPAGMTVNDLPGDLVACLVEDKARRGLQLTKADLGIIWSIAQARAAQEAYLATPAGQRAWEAQKAQERAEEVSEAVAKFTSMDIPYSTAVSLHTGRALPQPGAKRGEPLIVPPFELQLNEAMIGGVLLCIVLGVVGTGKTMSACRWLSQHNGLYATSKQVTALSPKFDKDRPRLEEFLKAPNLVLDEVGMEDEKDWGRIEELLHQRYEWHRPTVALANMKPKAFEARYKERIARRVSAMGKTIVARDVLCPGERRRLAGRQERMKV